MIVNKVERVLQMGQRFRDSDRLLMLAVWHQEGLVLTEEQRRCFLEKCTSAETITRARRKLKIKYPASKAVDEARFAKYNNYRYRQEVY